MTNIQWTNQTWNPLLARRLDDGRVGHACVKIAPECANCYAEQMNEKERFGRGTGLPYTVPALSLVELFLDEARLVEPLRWMKPRMVFPFSMTDWAGEFVRENWIDRVFGVYAFCSQHIFQTLTKRPERALNYVTGATNTFERPPDSRISVEAQKYTPLVSHWSLPLKNVWIGTSIGTQKRADECREPMRRLAELGWFTWVSNEPALEAIDWEGWEFIRWMVTGGESGPMARPFKLQWARETRQWCYLNNIPWFMKQVGSAPEWDGANLREARVIRHPHGGRTEEWPQDLRVREWPREVVKA